MLLNKIITEVLKQHVSTQWEKISNQCLKAYYYLFIYYYYYIIIITTILLLLLLLIQSYF